MKIENNIGWCDDTTNAVTGCQEVSPGCDNCYARTSTRARVLRHGPLKIETWGPKGQRVPVKTFAIKVRALNKKAICDACHTAYNWPNNCGLGAACCTACGGSLRRIRVFADSTSDWLDIAWSAETLANAIEEWTNATNLHIQLLTKRPQLWVKRMQVAIEHCRKVKNEKLERTIGDWLEGKAPRNLLIGTSVEDNKQRRRVFELLTIPAAVRFISAEPLLEGVDFSFNHINYDKMMNGPNATRPSIDWVIVGGESGPRPRNIPVQNITYVADQCLSAGIPPYVKQDVGHKSGMQGRIPDDYWKLKQMPLTK